MQNNREDGSQPLLILSRELVGGWEAGGLCRGVGGRSDNSSSTTKRQELELGAGLPGVEEHGGVGSDMDEFDAPVVLWPQEDDDGMRRSTANSMGWSTSTHLC